MLFCHFLSANRENLRAPFRLALIRIRNCYFTQLLLYRRTSFSREVSQKYVLPAGRPVLLLPAMYVHSVSRYLKISCWRNNENIST